MFHAHVPEASILSILSVLATSHQDNGSTFQILTKRPERARELLDRIRWRFAMVPLRLQEDGPGELLTHCAVMEQGDRKLPGLELVGWQGIPSGVWLGTSAEDQESVDDRLVDLTKIPTTPGGLRILSLEPLLGPVWIAPWLPSVDWVIVGAETGPGARPCEMEWIHLVIQQCWAASVPCFVKAIGPAKRDKDPATWPKDLRVRQWPA
jgi:protein gp37